MGFSASVCHWDNLEAAQPTARQWVKAALSWYRGSCSAGRSGNQIPFRKTLWGPREAAATTGLKSVSGEQLHSHSTASKAFLLLVSVCSVAWIPGSGTQPWVQPFGNYKGNEQRATSRVWGDTWDSLHSMLRLGVFSESQAMQWLFLHNLKIQNNAVLNNFVPKK